MRKDYTRFEMNWKGLKMEIISSPYIRFAIGTAILLIALGAFFHLIVPFVQILLGK